MDEYLIWSNEHRAWWGPNRCGYSPGLSGAGIYTLNDAIRICRDALPSSTYVGRMAELPVRRADVRAVLDVAGMVPAAVFNGER